MPTAYDGDYVSTWKAMAELQEQGRTTSVGVSNFLPEHLDRIIDRTGVVPAVNQIQVHPYYGNTEARTASLGHCIKVEAWAPIAQGCLLDDPVITRIADQVGRTPAQVTLRWHLERGDVIFPKSVHPERMRENFALFDFTLTPEQVDAIAALDRGVEGRWGPDPATFDWLPD
jgi:2,5-diketo-D-gluconate reductase A